MPVASSSEKFMTMEVQTCLKPATPAFVAVAVALVPTSTPSQYSEADLPIGPCPSLEIANQGRVIISPYWHLHKTRG